MKDHIKIMRDYNNGVIRPRNTSQNQTQKTNKNLSERDLLNIMRRLDEKKVFFTEEVDPNEENIEVIDSTEKDDIEDKLIFKQDSSERKFQQYFNDNDIFYEIKFGQIQQTEEEKSKVTWKGVFIIDDASEINSIPKEIRWTFKIPQINLGYDIQYIGVSAPNESTEPQLDATGQPIKEDDEAMNIKKITDGIKHLYKLFNEQYLNKIGNINESVSSINPSEYTGQHYNVTNDEFGNHMVYKKGDYKILVDSEYSPTHITLWYDNYNGWERVGALTVSISERRFDFDSKFEKYYKVSEIEIKPQHRNKGFGKMMYDILIEMRGNNIKGLYSHLPDRVNRQQIPSIYKHYKTIIQNDNEIILF